jgi:pre-mRNA-splicing factor ATP-dependent RNA helicase DHX16
VQDAKRRKYETEEERDDLLPRLRDFSRQEYLKKREDAKLQELEDSVRDEEMMFGCVPTTRCTASALQQHSSSIRSIYHTARPALVAADLGGCCTPPVIA